MKKLQTLRVELSEPRLPPFHTCCTLHRYCRDLGMRVIAVDDMSGGFKSNIPEGVEFVRGGAVQVKPFYPSNRSTHQVKPFYPSSETVLPIK
jgi:hypothetical protein